MNALSFGRQRTFLVISTYIYNHFKNLPEGSLQKCRPLWYAKGALRARGRLSLGDYLLLSKGEDLTGGRKRPSILADVMEAVIAAIYLDGGITEAEKFTVNLLKDSIEKVRKGKGKFKDYKTELQEQVQQNEGSLSYIHVKEEGPEHLKVLPSRSIRQARFLRGEPAGARRMRSRMRRTRL